MGLLSGQSNVIRQGDSYDIVLRMYKQMVRFVDANFLNMDISEREFYITLHDGRVIINKTINDIFFTIDKYTGLIMNFASVNKIKSLFQLSDEELNILSDAGVCIINDEYISFFDTVEFTSKNAFFDDMKDYIKQNADISLNKVHTFVN